VSSVLSMSVSYSQPPDTAPPKRPLV
jgi:hypothetical protein